MAIDEKTARQLLAEERRRLDTARDTVDHDLSEERPDASEQLSAYDQHPAERGTEVHDMSRDLGLRDDLDVFIRENDEALRRVHEGRYGTCERCGKPVGDERLRAMPSARFCIEDQLAEAV